MSSAKADAANPLISRWHVDPASTGEVGAFRQSVRWGAPGFPWTYLTRCRAGEFEIVEKLGISINHVLHGEQEYEFLDVKNAERALSGRSDGATLLYQTILSDHFEKKGASATLQFLVMVTEVHVVSAASEVHDALLGPAPGSRPFARAKTTFVVRRPLRPLNEAPQGKVP